MVRLRVDGLLQEIQRLPKWTQGALVSRIKVLANLDIAEKRQPQDGRLVVEIDGRRVDMRVSTPADHERREDRDPRRGSERRVRGARPISGFRTTTWRASSAISVRPQGILLVTGPTGSGKSTLLYSSLRFIQHETKNLVTVEDPVEFQIPGVNQVQVDEKAKKTFPAALRAILRQDPDVIMIGEIRDKETAQIAFRASVTGHLVLSYGAHQRCGERRHALDRPRPRAVHGGLVADRRREHATRAHAVPTLPRDLRRERRRISTA